MSSNYDVVTIRMSRSELSMPWGFVIQPPCIVQNIEGGSLADKAGLHNGDLVDELQFERNPAYEHIQNLMQSAGHELNIIVLREPIMTARIWKPSVSYGKVPDTLNSFSQQQQQNNNVRVSLQHQQLPDQKIYGFNQAPRQFGNTPIAKFDPNAPSYLRSEALKLIHENEKPPITMNNNSPPECFCCGRIIIGLMCNAFDKNLHPDCFQCSTCGSPLAQQGHHFISDKFYCDVHGKQRSIQTTPPNNNNAAPQKSQLKNPSRPFNTATNAYQNPENVVQPTKRFGQALVNNNFQPNATKTNNFSSLPQQTSGNRNKISSKSPAFQRRRKLQKPWPPREMSSTQKNAQALRFWKYEFEDKDDSTKLKSLIDDFESGKAAELDSKITREEGKNYARRVVLTPSRLNQPMRSNPFAWSNAEPPSSTSNSNTSNPTPIPASTPMSSSNSNQAKTNDSTVEQLTTESETPQLSNELNANLDDEEEHKETSWKFLSQILEEQDILTESTISSLKSSLSVESNKKLGIDDQQTLTRTPKKLTRIMSSIQMAEKPVQIVSSILTQNQDVKNPENLPKIKEKKPKPQIRIQKSMKQESISQRKNESKEAIMPISSQKIEDNKINEVDLQSLTKPLDDLFEEKLPSFIDFFPTDNNSNKIEAELTRRNNSNISQTNKIVNSAPIGYYNSIRNINPIKELSPPENSFQNSNPFANLIQKSKFFEFSSRENSTELSSLADLPPQMPELMNINGNWKWDFNKNDHLSHHKSIEDCFLKTGAFLNFITELDVLNDDRPNYQQTLDLLDRAENSLEFRKGVQNDFSQPPNAPISNPPDLNQRQHGQLYNSGSQIPRCEHCAKEISGSFVLATGKAWCPEHFTCANMACNRRLLDCGFVEEAGKKYCEKCFETLIAPSCAKCGLPITADCLNALQRQWHPECFVCVHCRQTFGNTAFYLENGQPYCEKDWNQLFTTKCIACNFPIEAGDRWIEAIGSAFHSNCFNCFSCQVNLEGQNFFARDGHPFCRAHA